MNIIFTSNKKVKAELLSVEHDKFIEVLSVNGFSITFRVVFGINLSVPANDPLRCKKVFFTLDTQNAATNFNSNSNNSSKFYKLNKLTPDMKMAAILRNQAQSNLKLNDKLEVKHSADNILSKQTLINLASQDRRKNFSQIDAGKQREIITYNIYVNKLIQNALNYSYDTIDLLATPVVNIRQDRHLNSDSLTLNNVKNEIRRTLKTPTEFFDKKFNNFENFRFDVDQITHLDEDQSFFAKKIFDYLMYDVTPASSTEVDQMTFFIPQKNTRKVNRVEIPFIITIPYIYSDSQMVAKLDLYTDQDFPEESVNVNFDMSKLVSRYQIISEDISLTSGNILNDYFSGGLYSVSYSFPSLSIDAKKITGYNVYTKSLEGPGEFTLFTTLGPTLQGTFTVNTGLDKAAAVVRVIPLTVEGESHTFSDIVIGKKQYDSHQPLTLYIDQESKDSIVIKVKGISTSASVLRLFRRNCTITPHLKFDEYHYIIPNSSDLSLKDFNVKPGEFYEYYAQVEDVSGNIIQKSSVVPFEVLIIANNKHDIVVKDVKADTNLVSFAINASFVDANNISTSLFNELKNYFSSTVNSDNVSETASQPILQNVISDSLIYVVKRIDKFTSQVATFPPLIQKSISQSGIVGTQNAARNNSADLYFDNLLFEDSVNKNYNNIPALVSGREYIYQIYAYVRNSLTTTPNFFITGNNRGKNWFYMPMKWHDPKVVNTGILYPDDISGKPKMSESEIIYASPLGLVSSVEITIPGPIKNLQLNPIAEKLGRSMVSVTWNLKQSDSPYDSFVVFKIVNGKKYLLGRTCKNYIYHMTSEEDLGTVYYQVTPLTSDYTFEQSYYSNSVFLTQDMSYKTPRIV